MDVADYYARASYDILRNIAKGLSHSDEKSEIRKLLAIARIRKENQAIIRKAMQSAQVRLRQDLLLEVRNELASLGEEWSGRYQYRAILQPIEAIERQAHDRLNAVNTVMGITADKLTDKAFGWLKEEQYRALSTATAEVASGIAARQEAMASAIRRMLDSGITGFVDSAGRQWTPEAYVAMDIATTLHNAKNATAKAVGEQAGANVYYVTTHSNSRPLCDPYQGRYYSTDGTYGTIYDINGNPHSYEPETNTTIGEPAGLFGINCKHDRIPVLNGLFRDRSKEEIPSDPEGYANTQRARAMERSIRQMKRDAGIYAAGGCEEQYKALQNRIDRATDKYYQYCESNGLRERDDRLEIYS